MSDYRGEKKKSVRTREKRMRFALWEASGLTRRAAHGGVKQERTGGASDCLSMVGEAISVFFLKEIFADRD